MIEIPEPGNAWVGAASVIEGTESVPTVMVAQGEDGGVAVTLTEPNEETIVLGDENVAEVAMEVTGLEEDHSAESWDGIDQYGEPSVDATSTTLTDASDLGAPETAEGDSGASEATESDSEAATIGTKLNISSRCTNGSYSYFWLHRWQTSMRWMYNPSGAPVSGHESAISGAATVVSRAQNACGIAVPALRSSHIYEGSYTDARMPNITSQASCNVASDWRSRVGWGTLPSNTLAYACTWFNLKVGVQQEADIKFNPRISWNTASTCTGSRYDLRGVAVHEFGHAFGLNHVSESTDQTMGDKSAYCDTFMRKLQRGDTLGMINRYR